MVQVGMRDVTLKAIGSVVLAPLVNHVNAKVRCCR
jgi:hypothetical protein